MLIIYHIRKKVIAIEDKVEVIKKEQNIIQYDAKDIKSLIYTIRGKQVMLDSDVAMLYHYETKNINKAMKRNIERFPEDFSFQLTEKELESLRFQFGTSRNEEKMWFQFGTTLQNENIFTICIYRTRNINVSGNTKE